MHIVYMSNNDIHGVSCRKGENRYPPDIHVNNIRVIQVKVALYSF